LRSIAERISITVKPAVLYDNHPPNTYRGSGSFATAACRDYRLRQEFITPHTLKQKGIVERFSVA
jgi:hypothetical protein